ncbi:MAG: hypothetical protein P9M15_07555 [Candidatus Electryoneaceae bacterium]|nr:hypothetical protein [Candidatus Electryoneaceae bacterium]
MLDVSDPYKGEIRLSLVGRNYLRADLLTRTTDGIEHHAYTNPIWLVHNRSGDMRKNRSRS